MFIPVHITISIPIANNRLLLLLLSFFSYSSTTQTSLVSVYSLTHKPQRQWGDSKILAQNYQWWWWYLLTIIIITYIFRYYLLGITSLYQPWSGQSSISLYLLFGKVMPPRLDMCNGNFQRDSLHNVYWPKAATTPAHSAHLFYTNTICLQYYQTYEKTNELVQVNWWKQKPNSSVLGLLVLFVLYYD